MPRKIRDRGDGRYELSVSAGYDSTGKQITRTKTIQATSMRAAEKQYSLFVAEIEKGHFSASGKMTLKEFYEYWLENYAKPHHAPKTILYNNGLWERIQIALGHKRIDKIEAKHILAFIKNLSEDGISERKGRLSQNTIIKYYILLHSLFEKAVQWQLLAYNPVKKVDRPKKTKIVKNIYEKDEAHEFFLALSSEPLKHQLMAYLLLSTGMRRGEMFGLQWKHINFNEHSIIIEQQCQYLPRVGKMIKSTKTEIEHKVSIPPVVTKMLHSYQQEQTEQKNSLGDKWVGANDISDNYVFTSWNGDLAHPDSVNSWMKKFIASHGFKKITPHSFRHMSATYLITSGVDTRTVAGHLGHKSPTTTQMIYSHLLKSAERSVADVMGNVIDEFNK